MILIINLKKIGKMKNNKDMFLVSGASVVLNMLVVAEFIYPEDAKAFADRMNKRFEDLKK